jgi:2-polyprenyl-3-methyl-5-hydroxy-6-metoxy-1,4-benzoquinol methylase
MKPGAQADAAPPVSSTAEPELLARRTEAAEQSRGTSDEPVYAAVERLLASHGAGGDLLDFGAGAGVLTRRLAAGGRFGSVTGADLFARPAELPAGVRWVRADLNDRVPLGTGSFDVVVAAEVIEHLENPRAVCREIFRLLRPDGLAVVTTPNNESWRALVALVARGHFVLFGASSYPAHITALVRKDLERSLCEAGFLQPSFSFTDTGGVPGRPSRSWQSLLGRRARGLRFSDNVLASARKPRS